MLRSVSLYMCRWTSIPNLALNRRDSDTMLISPAANRSILGSSLWVHEMGPRGLPHDDSWPSRGPNCYPMGSGNAKIEIRKLSENLCDGLTNVNISQENAFGPIFGPFAKCFFALAKNPKHRNSETIWEKPLKLNLILASQTSEDLQILQFIFP